MDKFIKELWAKHIYEEYKNSSIINELFPFKKLPKSTIKEKIRYKLLDWRDRISLAWRVLRGDDIHKDCE